jgi:transcription elongation factor S-II
MDVQEEVLKIKKSLEKMMGSQTTEAATAVDLLKQLKSMQMSLDILQKTRIGITVNNFRKSSSSDEVSSLSKGLIKSWKKFVHDNGSGHSSSRASRISRSSSSTSSRRDSVNSTTSSNDLEDSMNEDKVPGNADTSVSDGSFEIQDVGTLQQRDTSFVSADDHHENIVISKASFTKDSVRLKCRELIAAALKANSTVESVYDIDDIAAAVEDAIYLEFKNTEMKYKNRVRSRIANLKDPKNPRLRENVLLCHISPERLAAMTPEEMASDEMNKLREKLSREAFNDHQMAVNSGTQSDLFQCGRCKKRNTTYNQLQTRSSDEPMTTFVLCNECGNRWKFC